MHFLVHTYIIMYIHLPQACLYLLVKELYLVSWVSWLMYICVGVCDQIGTVRYYLKLLIILPNHVLHDIFMKATYGILVHFTSDTVWQYITICVFTNFHQRKCFNLYVLSTFVWNLRACNRQSLIKSLLKNSVVNLTSVKAQTKWCLGDH